MRFLQRVSSIILGIMFTYVLGLLFFFGNMKYINQRYYMYDNFVAVFVILLFFLVFYIFQSRKDISDKKYFVMLLAISFIILGIQFFIQTYGYFTQTWDAGHLIKTVNYFSRYGIIDDMGYMTRYHNNSMLTFILILIRAIPYFGKTNFLILIFNALLVNLAGVFTSLTVRNLTKNNKKSLAIYLFLIPLVLLSPWILVYYSDTFAILFPILILYIYTKDKKDYRDYFFICFCSFLGYFIKPTVIIILIAIVIVEVFANIKKIFRPKSWNKGVIIANGLSCILGIMVVLGINAAGKAYVQYYDVPNVVKFNMIHFMAMGLNEETDGIYNGNDVGDSMSEGMDQNFRKIHDRIFNRSLDKHAQFFARKTLVNFNDGSFAWGQEGWFFSNVRETGNKITEFIYEIILPNGLYNDYYHLIVQWIWLTVLFYVPSIIKKYNNKNELVIILTIIGISLFLTLFEARARYLYCYSPIFIIAFCLGLNNVKDRVEKIVR